MEMLSAPPSSPRTAWRRPHRAGVAANSPAHGPSGGTLVATYAYDANGRRTGKAVNGGTFERYVDADVETVSVDDGSHAWKQDLVDDVTGIDRVLMLEPRDVLDRDGDANTTQLKRSFDHRNALGSVIEITTASQTDAASCRYRPGGSPEFPDGEFPTPTNPRRGSAVPSSEPSAGPDPDPPPPQPDPISPAAPSTGRSGHDRLDVGRSRGCPPCEEVKGHGPMPPRTDDKPGHGCPGAHVHESSWTQGPPPKRTCGVRETVACAEEWIGAFPPAIPKGRR